MKSSLIAETDTSTSTTPAAPDSTALSAPSQSSLVPDQFFSNAEVEGDFERSDFKIPKLNLVQNVGPLTEHFTPGVFVYAKETDLGNSPIEITLVKLRKYFIEDLPYGSEQFPDIVQTIDEVHKKGAFLSKEKRQMGEGHTYYKPALDATVLIKGKPENAAFPFEFNGTPYALALWTLTSVAYSRTGTTLLTAAQLGLRNGLTTGYWTVTPKREKVGANFIWLPVARQAGKNPPDFIVWAKDLVESFIAAGNNQ